MFGGESSSDSEPESNDDESDEDNRARDRSRRRGRTTTAGTSQPQISINVNSAERPMHKGPLTLQQGLKNLGFFHFPRKPPIWDISVQDYWDFPGKPDM